MKIIDILKQDKMSLSFEVFPPKKETSFENVKAATEAIAALGPSFMSVTYGAGGGVSQYTLQIAKNLKEKFNLPMLAHLTCVMGTREGIAAEADRLASVGGENILALAVKAGVVMDAPCSGNGTCGNAHGRQTVQGSWTGNGCAAACCRTR